MIVDKTKLGVSFFDASFGGVYRGRQVLCAGRRGSGKSILACHFLNQAIQDGDKALLLTKYRAHDTIIIAESLGFPFEKAVTNGQLIILEYASFIPEGHASANVMLPPQSFMELQTTVESQSIRRVAFDNVLPWVAIHPVERLAEHVYSFIHAIERLGITALFTLPKPISNPAFTLQTRLEDLCPVVIKLDHENGEKRVLRVTKYLGEIKNLSQPLSFTIVPEHGIVDPSSITETIKPVAPPSTTSPADPAMPTAAPRANKPISFSSVIRFPE